MTPVMSAHVSAPSLNLPAVANVALAGFNSPITELFNTFNLLPGLLFSDTTLPGFPSPNPVSKYGLVPQIINDALPVVRQLGDNGSEYLQSTLNAVTITGQTASEAIWNLPQAVIESITTLSLTPLINAILVPINTIGTTLLAAGNYVLQGVIARATAVINGVIASIPKLAQAVIGQVTSLVNTVAYVGQSVVGGGSIEGAWNAAVDGLFGPGAALKPSIPGALVNLSLGLGQTVNPAVPTNPVTNPFVPSGRAIVSGLVQSLKAEVGINNPGTAVPTPPPAAALKAKARAAASVAAPVAAAPAGDSSAAADNSAPAEKPAAHRASRKAARAASTN